MEKFKVLFIATIPFIVRKIDNRDKLGKTK
jgi:hypothetical protein